MPASNAARRAAFALVALLVAGGVLQGCGAKQAPIRTEQSVDLQRFMGDWYVIANIPTSLEEGAHNAIESYRLDDDGTIATTFTFRDGSFDGEPKCYTPRGFVRDGSSNAVWGMLINVNYSFRPTTIRTFTRDGSGTGIHRFTPRSFGAWRPWFGSSPRRTPGSSNGGRGGRSPRSWPSCS